MSAAGPIIGQPIDRVDGALKVTGGARFAAEFDQPGLSFAVMVQSTVPRGRIRRIDRTRAERTPGVLAVLTHENAPALPQKGRAAIKATHEAFNCERSSEWHVRWTYFGVNEKGHIIVHPDGPQGAVADLKELVDEVRRRGIGLPLLLRFSNILRLKVVRIAIGRGVKHDVDLGGAEAGRFNCEIILDENFDPGF